MKFKLDSDSEEESEREAVDDDPMDVETFENEVGYM